MTPTIVLKEGKPLLVLGSPGGRRIITAVLQVMVNVLDHGMTVAQAVTAHAYISSGCPIRCWPNADCRPRP